MAKRVGTHRSDNDEGESRKKRAKLAVSVNVIDLVDDDDDAPVEVPPSDEMYVTKSMVAEEAKLQKEVDEEERRRVEKSRELFESKKDDMKLSQLDDLLAKATLYSDFLNTNVGLDKMAKDASAPESATVFKQPEALTGGTLRNYQLAGVKWLSGLWENGLNGILADEMGLGKTIQVISLIAHIRRMTDTGSPYLIVAPLSTLENWMREFKKFAPTIPTLLFHGSKEERQEKWKGLKKYHDTMAKAGDNMVRTYSKRFPVIITSYELVIRDRALLNQYQWKYIIVDEGHRLKNMNCLLIKQLKSLRSESRLLLTGTPLQNNLSELWSLLNFILPDVFDDLDLFQSWFDFSAIYEKDRSSEILAAEASNRIITKLHEIIRPFVLRRLKTQVIKDMPLKHEIIVYAGMAAMQREFYRAILKKEIDDLVNSATSRKKVSLKNAMVQMVKCCNHPYLIYEETDALGEYQTDQSIIENCGKLDLLDQILTRLVPAGHKVLIFSQMTRLLDILEDYLAMKKYKFCRIDGSVSLEERQLGVDKFNSDKGFNDIPIFLLSTRAGGLGINLTSADTCIIYDSDWNPHNDSQAMDRCHRIGQTKTVMVYRLATCNSVELKVLQRANAKKKLERVVIHSGVTVKEGKEGKGKGINSFTHEELEALLKQDVAGKDDGDYKGISSEELDLILDRSDSNMASLPMSGKGYEIVKQGEAPLMGSVE